MALFYQQKYLSTRRADLRNSIFLSHLILPFPTFYACVKELTKEQLGNWWVSALPVTAPGYEANLTLWPDCIITASHHPGNFIPGKSIIFGVMRHRAVLIGMIGAQAHNIPE